jgi:hypothetical protein
MIRSVASAGLLVAALALGAGLPRVALATPSLDACTGVLQREAGTTTAIAVAAPGTWCLDKDLVESVDVPDSYFAMIAVSADDVTIDCRGHRIRYTGTAATSMYGISTLGGRKRLVVRNCHLHGFSQALTAHGDGFLFEDNTVHASRANDLGSSTSIYGDGNGIIRRNRIRDAVSRAIYANGSSRVLDNLVDGVIRSSYQIHAIDVYPADGAEVRGNTVRGMDSLPAFSQDMAVQIDGSGGSARRNVVADNVFVHDGSEGDVGVFCSAGNVLVSDNVISGFFSPTAFCTDVIDNDISP